jgi:hypothetical protein
MDRLMSYHRRRGSERKQRRIATDVVPQQEFDDAGRLLAPDTLYVPVYENGKLIGYSFSDADRELVEAAERDRAEGRGIYARVKSNAAAREPRPVLELRQALDEWVDFSTQLDMELRDAYDSDPVKVTRICESILKGCEEKRLISPGGLLYTRLKEVVRVLRG